MAQCKHENCEKNAVQNGNGFCKKHFIESREEIYLDNTDPNNLGIVQWAKDMLPEYTPNKVPWFHHLIYLALLGLLIPVLKNKMERLLNIISWRGSAKSTICTMIFPTYLAVHNGKTMRVKIRGVVYTCKINERFICIVSETGEMAEDFVVRIRDEVIGNKRFRYFYTTSIEDAVDERTGQMTRRAFKYNGCYILGVGSGMQIRGRIKGAYRVTFLIADDIYSEKKVATETGRKGIRNWWNAAVKNSVDDLLGKIACLGTILHEDTINVDQMNNSLWKTIKMTLMPLEKFETFLHQYMEINESTGECKLPFDNEEDEIKRKQLQRKHFDKIQENHNWELSWPERVSLYLIALFITDAIRTRTLSLLYQEYFHEVVPASNKRFKSEFFQKMPPHKIFEQNGTVWLKCPELYLYPVPIKNRVAIDTASGQLDSDNSSITVRGVTPDNRWFILRQVYGKYGPRDETGMNTSGDNRYGKVITDRRFIKKIGYIDEAFRLAEQYLAHEVYVGYAGNEKTLVDETRKIFKMNSSRCLVFGRKQLASEGAKHERISATLHPHYSTYSVWHAEGMSKLEHELEYLGSTKEDDCADSAEVSCYDTRPPQWEEYDSSQENLINLRASEEKRAEAQQILMEELEKLRN